MCRNRLRISQRELARQLGRTGRSISMWEHEVCRPNREIAPRLDKVPNADDVVLTALGMTGHDAGLGTRVAMLEDEVARLRIAVIELAQRA